MQWTTRSFLYRAREWSEMYEAPNTEPGPKAYAARQSSQWRYLASEADRLFRSIYLEFTL